MARSTSRAAAGAIDDGLDAGAAGRSGPRRPRPASGIRRAARPSRAGATARHGAAGAPADGAGAGAAVGVRRQPGQRRRVVALPIAAASRRRTSRPSQARSARIVSAMSAARTPGVDVLDPEEQASAALAHREPRRARGADVAEVQPPRRRRRQPSDDHRLVPAAIPSISSPYERNIVSIVPTAMDQATSPRARISLPPRVASAGPGLRSGVVNCAAYESGRARRRRRGGRRPRGPDDARALRLDRPVRAGRGPAARGPARVRPARPRRRGRPQRAPAAQARGLRRLAVRRPAHGADERRAAAHRVRRDARLRRQELRRVGAARLAAVARRPAHALRGDARPAVARAPASSSTR